MERINFKHMDFVLLQLLVCVCLYILFGQLAQEKMPLDFYLSFGVGVKKCILFE